MSERKVFEDSVVPIPEEAGAIHRGLMINAAEPEHRNEEMLLSFSIDPPAQSQKDLEDLVNRGETIPVGDLKKKYGVKPGEIKALTSWLKANDYDIVEVSQDGASVYAKAKVDQIEKSLEVKMVRVTKDGITYTAAKNAPSLPAEVGKSVSAIIGLQPFRRAHKQFRILLHQS